MRVASRRLRAALPLFSSCFSEKDFRHWMRVIKKITAALGDARDTDVQIAFLKKYLKAQASMAPGTLEPAHAADPITALLSRLQKRRRLLQKQVTSVLDELEEAQVISSLREACVAPEGAVKGRGRERYTGILPVAADRIGRRLRGVHRFEPFVHNPDAVFEHHATRIAAKKLRYTLETYAPLYRRELKKPIARIKRLQDLLGDIHDCDVWIEQMTLAIIKQRARRHPLGAPAGAAVSAVAPLRRLLADRERCRARLYRQFVRVPGTPLSAPGSGMIWVWRCLKGSGRRSVTAGVFRQKGCARHLYGFLRRRPITKPTAAPSRRLPSGFSTNLLPFTAFPAATVLSSLLRQSSTISDGRSVRPGTRKKALNWSSPAPTCRCRSASRALSHSLPGSMAGMHPREVSFSSSRQPTGDASAFLPPSSGLPMASIISTQEA